jgi:2-iminobutanoate/2-iminopropanoate deaminase
MPELIPITGTGGAVSGSPYTPAVKVGNLLFISGQLGIDPTTKKPYDDFAAQVEGAINGVESLIVAAGGSLDNIVKCTCFLADINQFAAFNEIYSRRFSGAVKPARSTFQVAALPLAGAVEIEAIAVLD